jgi:hypothetical protein
MHPVVVAARVVVDLLVIGLDPGPDAVDAGEVVEDEGIDRCGMGLAGVKVRDG